MERLFFRKEFGMTSPRVKSTAGKIFDNIMFLAEVFGDQAEQDIPRLPCSRWRNVSIWKSRGRSEAAGVEAKLGCYGHRSH